jgi:hypothetical protein
MAGAASSDDRAPGDFKSRLIETLLEGGMKVSADALHPAEVTLDGSELRIRVPKAFQLALRDGALAKAAQKLAGRPVRVAIETTTTATAVKDQTPAQGNTEFHERALEHPGVKRFQELFPDAHVRTVRNLKE